MSLILWYILRRLRDAVIVLFLIGTAMFFLLHAIPGSPAAAQLGEFASPDQVAALEKSMGLDRPLIEQYGIWLGNALHGDLGLSFTQNGAVLPAIGRALGPTIVVAVSATVLAIAIAVPLAVHSISRPDSRIVRVLVASSSLGLSIPNFWLALMLVLVFAVTLRVLPVSGWVDPLTDPVHAAWYLVLPLVVILAHQVALLVMTLREGLSGEMLNAYVRTARAKGANEGRVLYRHVLPNALLPAITVVGSNFGALLGGIVIIETVFLIPGIGMALNNGITARDYNLILGLTLVTAVLIVFVNLVIDILYSVLDPRVRLR